MLLALLCMSACHNALAKPLHHYVYFGRDREKIHTDQRFLNSKAIEGAQIAYSWRELEHGPDGYDFGDIRDDLLFLTAKGKRLFVQIQDVTFSEDSIAVPQYLVRNPKYGGGADKQYRYHFVDHKEADVKVLGWMARRWDPAVRERFQKLLFELGKEFDGKIEGINLAETAFDIGDTGALFPQGFSFEKYRDGIVENMKALRHAFPRSVVIEYANFMPGEWLPTEDQGYLRSVYSAALENKVGVGGPDLLPYKPAQMNNSYPLIKAASKTVSTSLAVQDGDYGFINPQTGKQVTIAEIVKYAKNELHLDYIFWCTEEPFYSRDLITFISQQQ